MAIDGLLAVLLAFASFAYGTVEAWSEFFVILLTTAIAVCFAIKTVFSRHSKLVFTWAYLPMGLFLLVVVLQLVPFPSALLRHVSPNTIALRTQLLSDLPNASQVLQTATISFYPHATHHDLRLVLVLATIFFVVVNVYRRPEQIKRLLVIIVLIGGAAALLALAQDLTGATNIYWIGPAGRGDRASAGSFMTHSHYGQFMNLSIGAGLGLLLVKLHQVFGDDGLSTTSMVKKWRDPELRTAWLLAAFLVVGAVTVFLSGSRGAMVALLAGLAFTTLTLPRTRGIVGRASMAVPLLLGVCAIALFFGPDAIFARFSTLQSGESYADRWQILKDLAPAWREFPILGTGLGSHEVVYPMFSHLLRPETTTHAENEYAQVLLETGVVGLALAISFAVILWINYARALRDANHPIRVAAVGLGFGLFAIMLHSVSDFGQHLPGVACLTAVTGGLLVGLARLRHGEHHGNATSSAKPANAQRAPRLPATHLVLRLTATVVMLVALSWALIGAQTARAAEGHFKDAQAMEQVLAKDNWQGTNADMSRLISQADVACKLQPNDVKSLYSLNAYRWHAMCRVHDPDTDEVIFAPQAVDSARRIVDELHQSRLVCPTYGPLYTLAGEISITFSSSTSEPDLRSACLLQPTSAQACFQAALLDGQQQKWNDADAKFHQYLADGGSFASVAEVYLDSHRPDLARALAEADANRLASLAGILDHHPEYAGLATEMREESFNLLRAHCATANASSEELVSLAEQLIARKQNLPAIDCYRRALAQDYNRTNWHLALGQLLATCGQTPEAQREFRTCLRLDPKNSEATKRLGELRVISTSAPVQ